MVLLSYSLQKAPIADTNSPVNGEPFHIISRRSRETEIEFWIAPHQTIVGVGWLHISEHSPV